MNFQYILCIASVINIIAFCIMVYYYRFMAHCYRLTCKLDTEIKQINETISNQNKLYQEQNNILIQHIVTAALYIKKVPGSKNKDIVDGFEELYEAYLKKLYPS